MSQRVTLDELDMRARLRPQGRAVRQSTYIQRGSVQLSRKLFQDVQELQKYDLEAMFSQPRPTVPTAQPDPVVIPESSPGYAAPQNTAPTEAFMQRTFAPPVKEPRPWVTKLLGGSQLRQRLLTGAAVLVLVVGGGFSIAGFRANGLAHAQAAKAGIAAAIPATTTGSTKTPPNTAQVTSDTLRSYQVAPDMARYIRIPKIGVMARVLQVGTTSTGALATPTNVFDTAWYKNSAKPGQPGASLIDGHVSSWTTNGVFYDIKNLVAGDNIEIERGDGTKLEYTVNQTIAYPKDAVDMKALQKPITAGTSGLNLITCGGKYDSSAGEFTQRIAVYATLNN